MSAWTPSPAEKVVGLVGDETAARQFLADADLVTLGRAREDLTLALSLVDRELADFEEEEDGS